MEEVEKIGLGVDLLGGPELLTNLRAIRTEMEAIVALAGRGPTGPGNTRGPFQQRDPAQQRNDNRQRLQEQKRVTDAEITEIARGENYKERVKQRVQQRRAELLQSEQDETRRLVQERKNRISALAQTDDILNRSLESQRRAFRRHRNDPARDPQTNQYRRELAEEIQAQRQARRTQERDQLESQQRALSNRKSYFDADKRLQRQAIRDAEDFRYIGPPTGPSRRTFDAIERRKRQMEAIVSSGNAAQFGGILKDTEEARLFRQIYGGRNVQADQRRQELEALAERARERQQNRDFVTNDRQRQILEAERAANARYPASPPIVPPGGGGPPRGPGGRDPRRRLRTSEDALLNERGFFTSADVVGRITRNILLYEVVSRASYGLVNYVGDAISAAKATVEYANALRFATEQAGGNIRANQELADSLLGIGLSRQQGRQAVTEAARFTEDRPQDIGALVGVATNIAASYGLGIDKTDELIEQLRRRESKFYKRRFGTTVESIYETEALTNIRGRTTNPVDNPDLYIGINRNEIKSLNEEISLYVNNMTDAQKENAVLNYILAQAGRFQGEAAERAATLAGRLDKLSAAWLNSKENLGLFITDLRSVNNLIDYLTGRVDVFNSLRPAQLGRTGPNGTITNFDVQQYGLDRATGTRARVVDTVDSVIGPALLAAATAGILAFAGRRSAFTSFRTEQYNKFLAQAVKKFDGDYAAATQEAVNRANQTRPGLFRAVSAGTGRFTDVVLRGSEYASFGRYSRNGPPPIYYGGVGPVTTAQGPYSALTSPADQARTDKLRGYGGFAGGAIGAYAGASIASFVADRITSNTIVAGGLTVLGGVAGTAAGTAIGDVLGGALGARLAGGAGLGALLTGSAGAAGLAGVGILGAGALTGYGIGSILSNPVNRALGTSYGQQLERERQTRIEEGRALAYTQQQREFQDALREGRVRYRDLRPGGATGLLRSSELPSDVVGDGQGGLRDFAVEIISKRDAERANRTQEDISAAIRDTANNPTLTETQKNQITAQLELQSKTLREYGTTDQKYIDSTIIPYRAEAAERERVRKDKELQDRQKYVNQLTNAFGKLRDAQQGSFRLVGDVATTLVGEDNQYVRALSDQITAAERMRQQWGFLGQAAVDYFTKLEQKGIRRQLTNLDFESYITGSNLRGQSLREIAERGGPGLSRREQDQLGIESALFDRASQRPGLTNRIEQNYGLRPRSSVDVLEQRIRGLRIEYLTGQGGLGAEALGQLQDQYSELVLSILDEAGPGLTRRAGLEGIYGNALFLQRGSLDRRIQEARQKAQFGSAEDARLQAQLQRDEVFRRQQLASGADVTQVGRRADELLLSRTEGINAKDLTFEQFRARQEALRRQADRAEQDRQEAKAAVAEGIRQQQILNEQVAAIRAAILGGDISMLIQVQNDTQSRIDQNNLEDVAGGRYSIPLDTGETKSNPYTGSFDRYGRGGRKK